MMVKIYVYCEQAMYYPLQAAFDQQSIYLLELLELKRSKHLLWTD